MRVTKTKYKKKQNAKLNKIGLTIVSITKRIVVIKKHEVLTVIINLSNNKKKYTSKTR